jgi:lysophospholipase L1-like esterase
MGAVKRYLLVAAAALGASAGSWAVADALGRGTSSSAARSVVRASYYLALGDSVAVATGRSSYPYLILARYQRRQPGLRLDDIAIAGATTSSMLSGQYAAARSFLKTHRGRVALITIDIGGNDVAGCYGPGGVNQTCFSQAQATIKHNLGSMLAGVRKAAPGARIIGMTYYNPFLGYWLAGGAFRSFALSTVSPGIALNHELTALYGGTKETADVQGAFRATDLTTIVASRWGQVPIAVARACSWLAIQCQPGAPEGFGLDPNAVGEAHIASAFERTIGVLCGPGQSAVHGRCRPNSRRRASA